MRYEFELGLGDGGGRAGVQDHGCLRNAQAIYRFLGQKQTSYSCTPQVFLTVTREVYKGFMPALTEGGECFLSSGEEICTGEVVNVRTCMRCPAWADRLLDRIRVLNGPATRNPAI